MKTILSERNLVVLLFVMVLVTFSLAHEDTKKMEYLYNGGHAPAVTTTEIKQPELNEIPETPMTAIPAVK